jgi:hypothetical protein
MIFLFYRIRRIKMKNMKVGLLIICILIGMTLGSCKMDGTDNDNDWEQISSVNDIAGLWEGTFSVNVPSTGDYNELISLPFGEPIPSTSVSYENYQIGYVVNSPFMSTKIKMVYDKLLEDTIALHGEYTKDSLWNNLEIFYEPIKEYMNMTIEKYYTITESDENINGMDFSAFFLHKDKNKLKLIIPLSQTYKQEVIFYKDL